MVFLSSTLSKSSRRNVTWVCGVVRAHERYKFWWTVHGVPSFLNIRQFGGFKIGADPQHGAPSFCCLNSNLKDMMVALSVFSKKDYSCDKCLCFSRFFQNTRRIDSWFFWSFAPFKYKFRLAPALNFFSSTHIHPTLAS
jgi:hypothetical protein